MVGQTVGEYCLTGYLGAGGMGEVYQAQHLTTGATVAIKLIRDSLLADESAKRQFQRGANAAASLDHPHICKVSRATEDKGRVYVVMSYCAGGTVQRMMASGPCDVRTTLEIVRAVADGLAHAHRRRVVHRDIKPANLMFDADGTVKIVDFDLAKLLDTTTASTGMGRSGTTLYMSPEQLNGDPVDGRADVFALGLVLYEMLTGEHPFHAQRPETVAFRIFNDYPKPLAEVLPDLPKSLQQVIDRALQKDPQVRYQTAGEMRDNVQAVLDGDEELTRQKKPRSKRTRAAIGAALAAALAAAVLPFILDRHEPTGVAVVSTANGGSAEDVALARGLAHDMTDRARFFARNHEWFWVVTPDRLTYLDYQRPEDIRETLGAEWVVTIGDLSTGTGYELQGYAVASPSVLNDRLQVDFAAPLTGDSIDVVMQRLLGVQASSRMPGYTRHAGAYRAYLVGIGHLASRSPDFESASASLARAVANDSTFARAWAALGETYKQRAAATKDAAWLARAEAACRRALAFENDLPEAWVTLGQLQAARQERAEAIDSYDAALAIDRRNNFAYWRLADVHIAAGHDEEAVTAYAAAATANPHDPRPLEWLGFYLYRLGNYRAAIAPLERVLRLIPTSGTNYNILGGCYFAINCWEDATAMFEKSLDLERTYQACTNLGTLYYMNHLYDDAVRMYEWALEYNRSDYAVMGALGAAQYWSAGRREQGVASYREAARLAEQALAGDSENALLLAEISGYYAVIGHDSTVAAAERAVRLDPGNSDVLFRVAMTYEHLGKRPKALALLRAAIQRGYSLRHVENEPFLADLRKDIRYDHIVSGLRREPWCEP